MIKNYLGRKDEKVSFLNILMQAFCYKYTYLILSFKLFNGWFCATLFLELCLGMVLGYFLPYNSPSNMETLGSREAAASWKLKKIKIIICQRPNKAYLLYDWKIDLMYWRILISKNFRKYITNLINMSVLGLSKFRK